MKIRNNLFMMACGLLMLSIAPRAAFAQPTAQEWNRDVIGWNLGNQLECPAPGLDNESMDIGMAPNSINAETAWGNPVVTRKTIEAVREAGFNAVRIPVQWSCHITNPRTMTIDPAWMSRVREIIGWCLDSGLKVIVNTHHDKWLEGRPTNQYKAENNRRLAQLWTNIARALSQYDYRVAFAGTNEVHIRDNWGKPAAENLAVQNSYNQTFVNAVRATGGKNAKRHLIVQTYVCNPDFGLDGGGFIIPTDTRANGNRYMSVEFHYYTPWDYAGEGKYYFWGEPYKQYGQTAPSDEQEMARFFDRVAATWSAKGLGIVIGEWGVSDHYNAPQAAVIHENMAYYCRFLVSEACKRGFSTFIWDNNAFGNGQEKFGIFDRSKGMTVRAPWILQGLFGSSAAARQSAPRPYAVDEALERRVEATLAKMTLDEKIGQMLELSLDALGKGAGDTFQFDEKKLHEAIAVYKVGSVLNAPGPVAVSPQRWRQIIGRIQELSMKEIGIPCIYGLDQNHGVTYTMGGILFPQNINLGASFNPQLAEEAGRITAYETRAANCPWTYSPTVDLSRDPRWPRVWENYGEDPLVNALMGSAAVRGFQGTDPNRVDRYHIAACMKHYLGYGSPRTGKDRTPTAALSAILTKCGDEVDSIYNLGVGGSLEAKEAPIFSFVTSKCLYEHDLDTSAIGDPVGLISGINLIEIPADKALSEKASKAAKRLGAPIVSAVISSGDVFYDKKEDKDRIRNQFGSLCVDMESAPFGQIAYVYQKPYLAVRCISDAGDGGQFYENLEKSCALLKDFALELIKD